MPLIRILHASDLHISTRPDVSSVFDLISSGMYIDALHAEAVVSSHSSDVLYYLAEFLYQDYEENFLGKQAAPIDAVLLTGDIATTGLFGDLQLALRTVAGPPMPTEPLYWSADNPTLAGSTGSQKIPLWLLPGNHDRLRPHLVTWYAAGGCLFDDVFRMYWGPIDPITSQGPKVKEYEEISRPGLTVKVFAADFTLKDAGDRSGLSPHNQWAQGRVYPEILAELVQKTLDARRRLVDPLAILWAIHFPPRFPGTPDFMRLIDEENLIREAAVCGVDAILAGHTHEPVWYRSPGTTYNAFCSGTTTQKHTPLGNFFYIHNIEVDANSNIIITADSYKFDSVYNEFVSI